MTSDPLTNTAYNLQDITLGPNQNVILLFFHTGLLFARIRASLASFKAVPIAADMTIHQLMFIPSFASQQRNIMVTLWHV